jgi:hypothetical protein
MQQRRRGRGSGVHAAPLSPVPARPRIPSTAPASPRAALAAQMNDLNEPTLLHNLRQRFLKDDIYTCVGS